MSMLEMMYVYFDINGDIKTISPDPITMSDSYSSATFPLSEVEGFLLGKKNPFEFYIKSIKGITGIVYKITRKQVIDISLVRKLDNFLTEVKTMPKSSDAFLLIENISKEQKIKITINKVLSLLLNEGDDKDQEAITAFMNNPSSSIFFTKKGDPYFLLYTLTFSPKELFDKGELFWDYSVDLSNTSVYTKKIIEGYSYRIK